MFGLKISEVDTTVEWLSLLIVAALPLLLAAAYSIGERDTDTEAA